MHEENPDGAVLGYYVLDGTPVLMHRETGLRTWDGRQVDRASWTRRAVWITLDDYRARVLELSGRARPSDDE